MSDMAQENPEVLAEVTREVKALGDDVKGLHDSFRRDLEAARQAAEEARKEAKKLSTSASEEAKLYANEQVKALSESAVQKYEALQKLLDERTDEIKTAMRRPMFSMGEDKADAKLFEEAVEFKKTGMLARGQIKAGDEVDRRSIDLAEYKLYRKAFFQALRKDERTLGPDEMKALTTGTDPDGGYFVPTAMSQRIIDKVYESSPIRQLATVENIGTNELEIPSDTDEAGAGWVGEEEARPETTTPRVASMIIPVHELYAKPKATQRVLEDASIDLEAWLATKIADKFARLEATAFLVGNGVKKPRGLLTYPAGTGLGQIEQAVTGDANLITADSIMKLPWLLQERYHGNARWLLKRSSLAALAVLKDTTNNYLWSPGLREGAANSLAGYPVAMADDIPAVAAGALVALFGDFRAAYTVVERLGIRTLRDPYSAKPFVEFYTRRRVGGDVVDKAAVKILKVAAA